MIVESLPMFGFGHVYEIYDYYTAHIAETQLAGYFVGRTQIHLQGIALLIGRCFGSVSGVYVHNVKSLCVLDYNIGT